MAGEERAFVQVEATPALYPFITTRPEEVEALAAEGLFTLESDGSEWTLPVQTEEEETQPAGDAPSGSEPTVRLLPPASGG